MPQGTQDSRPATTPHTSLMWAKCINLTAGTRVCVLLSGAYLLWGLGARLAVNNPTPLSLPHYQPPGLLTALLIFATLVIVLLVSETRKRTRIQKLLSRRLALEGVTAELSSRLTARSPEKADAESNDILSRALESHGADWIGWYMKREVDSNLERVYSASASDVSPAAMVVKLQEIPNTAERLMRGEVVILPRLGDLPVDANMDQSFFRGISAKSLVLIPSNGSLIVKGILGMASFFEETQWASESIVQLSIIANLLVSIAERKQARAALLENEQLFQDLFRSAAIGIALEDLEGRPLFANPALCSLLGFTEEELCEKHCFQFSPPEDSRKDWALFEQLRSGSIDNYHLEKRYFRKDGSLIWGRLSVSLLNDRVSSSPVVVAMVEDITEKRVAEENLQRSESNLQNLATRLIQVQEEERHRIARELHDDIGQRLALLTIDLENLKASLAETGQDADCQLVTGLQRRTDDLTTDVHNLSRDLHSSKLQILGLPAALQELCTKISAQQDLQVALHVGKLPGNLPAELTLCIFRVVQEALNNVIKHSQAQDVFVELTWVGDTLILKVTDFGVGFDPLSPHTGIGISSMRERLRMFGGELLVESTLGNGTEIIAKVKLGKAGEKAATAD